MFRGKRIRRLKQPQIVVREGGRDAAGEFWYGCAFLFPYAILLTLAASSLLFVCDMAGAFGGIKVVFLKLVVLGAAVYAAYSVLPRLRERVAWLAGLPGLLTVTGTGVWLFFGRNEIVGGAAAIADQLIEKINFYYESALPYIRADEGLPAESGAAVLFFLAILFWWQAVCILRWRNVFFCVLPNGLLLLAELLIGETPGEWALILLLIGTAGALPFGAFGRRRKGGCAHRAAAAVQAKACLLLVLLVAGGLFFLYRNAPGVAERALVHKPELSVFQSGIEERLAELGEQLIYGGRTGRIADTAPRYEEKEVMELSVSEAVKQRVYLRGEVWDTYENGVWTNRSRDLFPETAAKWQGVPQGESGAKILNMPYLMRWRGDEADVVRYEICYTDTGNDLAYFPYDVDLDHVRNADGAKEAITVEADAQIFRNGKNRLFVYAWDGQSVNQTGQVVYADMIMLLNNYEDYLPMYLEVPENMTELRELGGNLYGKLELMYGNYWNNRNGKRNSGATWGVTANEVRNAIFERTRYSLYPESPGKKDAVEYFLFDSGQGFCQQYASAGTLLLRLEGIPARYVTGYAVDADRFVQAENGTYKASVRDSDAHAWTEVFIDKEGWIPVEMTKTVEETDWSEAAEASVPDTEELPKEDTEEKQNVQEETETGREPEEESEATEKTVKERSRPSEHKEAEEKEGGKKGWFFLAGTLLLLTGAFFGWRTLLEKERQKCWKEKSSRRQVRNLSEHIFTLLRRKGIVSGKNPDDREFRERVKRGFGSTWEGDLDRYFDILERAAFSDQKIDGADVRFCCRIYWKIKRYSKRGSSKN